MASFDLYISGVKIILNTPGEFRITEKFRPFLDESSKTHAECRMILECCEKLPEKFSETYQRETTCYTGNIGKFRNFYYEYNHETPFAVTCMEEKGVICQKYLQDYKKNFRDIASVFRYAGLEGFLMSYERLLLHASFVKYNEKGILFSAPSGMGKSTQAELWQKTLDAAIINGDRAAIGCAEGRWMAWGLPYAGSSGIYKNESAPIGAIVVLRKGTENKIKKLEGISALKELYPEVSMHPWDREYIERAVELLQKLICSVPIYLLECIPEESAVRLLKDTLEKEGIWK